LLTGDAGLGDIHAGLAGAWANLLLGEEDLGDNKAGLAGDCTALNK